MEKITKSAYDIEIDINTLLADGALDSYFYLEDLRNRRITLNQEIDQFVIDEVVSHIMRYNKEDKDIPVENRKPIILYIVSNGGEVDSGFELIDVIQHSKTPVYTVNLGYQYSMGFLIGIAGHKRYAMPNAKFLMHDGSSIVYDSSSKVQDRTEFMKKIENRIRDYVLTRTGISPKEYRSKQRVEWYMFADEAKNKGVTDFIIGVDCELDEVL